MQDHRTALGGFEELVLLAVSCLGDNAYGRRIRETVEQAAGRTIAIGAVYTALERLEAKGFLSSQQGEPLPERGGRARRYYQIEGTGAAALEDAERVRTRMRSLLPAPV